MRRLLPALTLALALAACAPGPLGMAPAPTAGTAVAPAAGVPALVGRAAFGGRTLQAAEAEVAAATAITLIDTGELGDLHTPVASTITAADGAFALAFPAAFTPVPGRFYLLQATKGLGGNATGHQAVRLRTVVRFEAGAWEGLTAGAGQAIDATTTAIAMLTQDPAADLGAYDAGTGAYTGSRGDEVAQAAGAVRRSLAGGEDPIWALSFGSGAYRWTDGPLLTSIEPAVLVPGTEIALNGLGFGAEPDGVAVDFGDGTPVAAAFRDGAWRVTVPAAATDTIRVLVPGAASAPLRLATTSQTLALDFTATDLRDAAATTLDWSAGANLRNRPGLDPVDGGSGEQGDLTFTADDSLPAGTYQFRSLTIPAGVVLSTVPGTIIRVQGDVRVAGQLLVASDAFTLDTLQLTCGGTLTVDGEIRSIGAPAHDTNGAVPAPDLTIEAGTAFDLRGKITTKGGDATGFRDGNPDDEPTLAGAGAQVFVQAPAYTFAPGAQLFTTRGDQQYGDPLGYGRRMGRFFFKNAAPPAISNEEIETVDTWATQATQVAVTRAIDRGAGAPPITGAWVAAGWADNATLAWAYQASADGVTWGSSWIPVTADLAEAARVPAQAGRYVRVRVAMGSADRGRAAELANATFTYATAAVRR